MTDERKSGADLGFAMPAAGVSYPLTDDDLDVDLEETMTTYPITSSVPRVRSTEIRANGGPAIVPAAGVPDAPKRRHRRVDDEHHRRGTADLGLLILRLSIGGIMLFHGLRKITGWWGGPGFSHMAEAVAGANWKQPHLTAVLFSVGETLGGLLIILGLATPVAASAVLAIIINSWLTRLALAPGLQFTTPGGPEYQTMLAAMATSVILAGPGRLSFDRKMGWATRPHAGSLAAFLAAVAVAAGTWVVLHGGNPFV